MYINLWSIFFFFFFFFGGHPENVSFVQFSKILLVSDKTIHKAFRIHKNLYTIPIR